MSIFHTALRAETVAEEFINIAAILIEEHGFAGVQFGNLNRVTQLDAHADLALLQAVEDDIRHRLTEAKEAQQMIRGFLDSLSNMIQITGPKSCLTEDPKRELELLAKLYLG